MNKILLFLVICCLLNGCSSAQETIAATEPAETTHPYLETAAPVSPLPSTIDVNQLDNGIVAVSFGEGDAYVDDTGAMQLRVTVYDYDLYDLVDISRLKVGDTIVIRQQEITVTALEWSESGAVLINGGLDLGGYELWTDDNTVFYETGYSDVKSWHPIGEATIPVSPDFLYHDRSDLDKGEVTYYPGDFLVDGTGIDYHFTANNTTITIEDGLVTSMERVYVP